jgi:hypothetical protein
VSTAALYLLDPEPSPAWAPFAGARPIAELRAGAALVRERWETALALRTREILALPHLVGFDEADVPPVAAFHPIPGPAVVASSTFAPQGPAPPLPPGGCRLVCEGVTVGWGVAAGTTWNGPEPGAPAVEMAGLVLHGVHDLVPALAQLLPGDLAARLGGGGPVPGGSTVLGDVAGIALLGAAIEPGVTFDTRGGPIVLEAGVEVRGGTRLEGPLWAGPHARLLGGRIATSAIGPAAVVHGEMVASVLLGYANKSHDGFVGHSVLGRWVNLGAGTTTSNLKNTYGPVRLTLGSTAIDTGARNLGSLIGDHAKIAIGTLLSAGTVIGTGANVFDAVRAPRYVAPFAWGGSGPERVNCEGFLRVAERVLPRRGVAVSDATRALLARVHAWATAG